MPWRSEYVAAYDFSGFEVESDQLCENELDLDCSLHRGEWTILVSTEISAMNHSGQLACPQN